MEIDLLMAASNSYMPYLSTCFVSVLYNSKENEEFNLYVVSFTDELDDDNIRKLESLKAVKDFSLKIIEVDVGELAGFYESAVTLNTYLRLFVPDKLPDLDRIIYLDCDMIVLGSLGELHSIDLGDNILGASLDSDVVIKSSQVWDYVKKINPLYFNAGMLLMNLEEMRKDNLTKRMQEWLSKGGELIYADQDALNYLYRDRFVVTPLRFNAQFPLLAQMGTELLSKERPEFSELKKPVIIHFCTAQKPWLYLPEPPYKKEFKKYFDMTPWKGAVEKDKTFKNIIRKTCRRGLAFLGLK